MPEITVTMYTLSTCPWCRKAKQYFTDKGVPYESTDVDLLAPADREAVLDRVHQLVVAFQYPIVVINGAAVQGYNPDRYADLLRQAGW